MGIASRTKWERRVNNPARSVRHINLKKLFYHARLFARTRSNEELAAMLANNIHIRHCRACDALTAKRKRKAMARMMRGWLPMAKR